jgi:histidine ammonia-lyase
MHPVTVGERAMELDELLAVAAGAPVILGDATRATIAASRDVVDRMLERDEPVYGLNTGVGHLKDTRLPVEELRATQLLLLMSHAGGLGDPAPTELVRAAMAARLNGIARGGSGASPAVADVLVAMLNGGVHPIVPSRGSVGAGDLGQLATVGQVAVGAGRAELHGEVAPGSQALELAGIEQLRLEPKDGLAFMSSNAFSIAAAALALDRAAGLAELADVVAALSMEATAASPSVVHPAVAEAKPLGGQRASADTIRGALEGGDLAAGLVETSVQAPLSFRVIPQVHGAVRGSLDAAEVAVLVELNGRGDNPLVSIEHSAMIHNGNFDAVAMAIAFDQVRLALAHLGHLSERRMSHLWDAFFSGGPPAPPPEAAGDPSGPPVSPAFFGIPERYPAAASWAELRRLADPATLDVPALDLGIEDVASNAPASVAATDDALDLVEELLSIEVLMASDVLATRPSRGLGTGTAALLDRARDAIASLGDHATPVGAQRAVADAIRPARRSASGR